MKRLIAGLQRLSVASREHVELMSKLTLRDLGFYVSDADAMQYMKNESFPLADTAFQLENALHQYRFSGPLKEVSPMPWKASKNDIIGCSTLYQDDAAVLCWFVIPPGKALPLHDHPGMKVWQRVMYGHLHICTIAQDAPAAEELAAASEMFGTVIFDGEVHGVDQAIPASEVLHFASPKGAERGVLHELHNIDTERPALFLDIISPPYYQAPTNIPCGYYDASPLNKDAAALPYSLAEGCGVHQLLKEGDKVLLRPRRQYTGPQMNAFVHIE